MTGHQELPQPDAWPWVRGEIEVLLASVRRIDGLSSLAAGADQVFAEVVLGMGGDLTAVIPFPGYELRFRNGREKYSSLLSRATDVVQLPAAESDQEGYFEAGKWIVDHADWLIAVWDGLPSRGWGGTADIVAYAERLQRRMILIDPLRRIVTAAYDSI